MAVGQGKSSDFFKEMKQLELRIQTINREKDVQLYKRSPANYHELADLDSKMTSDLKNDRIKTKKEVYKLKSMVQKFHGELKDVKPTPEFLEKLKVVMEEIETSISDFKEMQREKYEEMVMSEVQYSHEINALEKRIGSWNELAEKSVVQKPVSKLPTARDVMKHLPTEVVQYEKFLQENGGIRGGWDEYDHNTFLKWRMRHKGRQQFLSDAISHLITKTPEEVANHETWYREFLTLQEQKKMAIKAWKQQKNEQNNEQIADWSNSDEEEAKHEEKQKQELYEKERQERLKKLGAWKLQKELERAEEEERKLKEKREQEEKEREERRRQERLRAKIADYKNFKQAEQKMVDIESQARIERRREEEQERLRLNKERIEMRNSYALQQKVKHLKETERQRERKLEREERLRAQYQVSVARDPNRLFKPTLGWKSRTEEVGASAEAGRIYTMQHRAIPSWRQGL